MEKIALKGKRFFEKNDYNILRVLSNKLEKDSYLVNLQTSETSKTIEMDEEKLFNSYIALKPHFVISLNYVTSATDKEYQDNHDIIIAINKYPNETYKGKEENTKPERAIETMISLGKYLESKWHENDGTPSPEYIFRNINPNYEETQTSAKSVNLAPIIRLIGYNWNQQLTDVIYGYIDDEIDQIINMLDMKQAEHWIMHNYEENGNPWCIFYGRSELQKEGFKNLLKRFLKEVRFNNEVYNIINVVPMEEVPIVPLRYLEINLFVRDLVKYTKVPINKRKSTNEINLILNYIAVISACVNADIDYNTLSLSKYSSLVDIRKIKQNTKPNEVLLMLKFNNNQVLLLKYKSMDSFQMIKETGKSPLSAEEMSIFMKKKL